MSLVQIYGFKDFKQVKIKITRKPNRFNLKQKCELVHEMILIGLYRKIPSGLDIRLIRYSLFYEIIQYVFNTCFSSNIYNYTQKCAKQDQ